MTTLLMISTNRNMSFSEVLGYVLRRVTLEMNQSLVANYSNEEIKEQMVLHPTSSPDDMSPLFFQKFWDIVGVDVICVVHPFLFFSCILHQLNYTMVSLIPKVSDSQHMSQLRLFALCNVLYKIGLKVIVNRLKGFIGSIILD